MNIRRKLIAALGAGALVVRHLSFAQQPAKTSRIGFLGTTSAADYATRVDAVRAGLRDRGYVEGKNLVIEYRWADGRYERLPGLAAELVRLNVDVLVTHSTPGTLAAKGATTTIPIVSAVSGDAVAAGLVASLARPGGNVTGSTFFDPELSAKRLELLKEILPRATRFAALANRDNLGFRVSFQAMENAGKSLNVEIQKFEVRGSDEFSGAFAAMAKQHVDAVTISQDTLFFTNAGTVADLAVKQRLPAAGIAEFAQAGGLIGYGVNNLELYRRAAYFVDRILQGAKPADLPVERATRFELIVNLRTAKALGIKIPNAILVRADKVIE